MAPRRNGMGSAAVVIQPAARCAAYVRVSTDDQANKEYSSLEAQLEAAKAYVASQRQDGWALVPDTYCDPGYSGSHTSRPGLQRLLADIEARKIDVVVVYKFDRLSRSMLDFLQVLAFFKKHNVSFVSVSQRFDTSTPVGEMTLNILLSFAQFERQIIAERTRDKIRAARRRGRWTGGMPPLGFDVAPEGGRLVVNKDEAASVQSIFQLYLERDSLLAVVQELSRRGWRRKTWTTRDGRTRQGREFNVVDVQRLLRDVRYTGKQTLGGEIYKGEHPAIISKGTFEQVQRLLDGNRRNGGASHRNRHGALLRGILRCAACGASMTHAFTERNGKAFRYYRCSTSVKNGAAACPGSSVPALKIEDIVVEQIRKIGSDPALCAETFRQVQAQVANERRVLKSETKQVEREIANARTEIGRITATIARATGSATDALLEALAEAQERFVVLERRLRDVAGRRSELASRAIDPEAVRRALEQFTDVWHVLLTPERERVVRLLIERVEYHGGSCDLSIAFSPAGVNILVTEASR